MHSRWEGSSGLVPVPTPGLQSLSGGLVGVPFLGLFMPMCFIVLDSFPLCGVEPDWGGDSKQEMTSPLREAAHPKDRECWALRAPMVWNKPLEAQKKVSVL